MQNFTVYHFSQSQIFFPQYLLSVVLNIAFYLFFFEYWCVNVFLIYMPTQPPQEVVS